VTGLEEPSPRIVTLVLVTHSGEPLGRLPPFEVAVPWWQEAAPVVRAARDRFGIEATILRLLEAASPGPGGGAVTYLAAVQGRVPDLEPWLGALDDHPRRATWARPAGPPVDLAWANAALDRLRIALTGPPEQIRSWNLSSLWRLPTMGGGAWLKVVAPFLAHEGRLIERLQGGPVPALLAWDGPRSLMTELPGRDLYEAPEPILLRMVSQLVRLQRAWPSRIGVLLELGLPDWRGPALTAAIAAVVERVGPQLAPDIRRQLDGLIGGLAARYAAIDGCGLPDTLVHGDFHPGNHRGTVQQFVLLDWGDSGVGHPLLDQAAFFERLPQTRRARVRDHWHGAWRDAIPAADPGRAAGLLAPIAAARQAVIYQHFLDHIEPSEHPYHAADPAEWLGRTAALL
jgi:hypothetical protein